MRLLFILMMVGLLAAFVYLVLDDYKEPVRDTQVYLGAVPEGYDLDYFRKTGITRRLDGNSN